MKEISKVVGCKNEIAEKDEAFCWVERGVREVPWVYNS